MQACHCERSEAICPESTHVTRGRLLRCARNDRFSDVIEASGSQHWQWTSEQVGQAMLPLALTMGDPAGIGGELTLRAWLALRGQRCHFVALDDPDRLTELGRRIGCNVPIREVDDPQSAAAIFPEALPVLPVRLPAAAVPAIPTRQTPAPSLVRSNARPRSHRAARSAGSSPTRSTRPRCTTPASPIPAIPNFSPR